MRTIKSTTITLDYDFQIEDVVDEFKKGLKKLGLTVKMRSPDEDSTRADYVIAFEKPAVIRCASPVDSVWRKGKKGNPDTDIP